MTTLLVHIRIKPGKEAKWEAIIADMVTQTFATEEGVGRYEYWKGQEQNAYYCLLSFDDKWAFYAHQMSDHHEGHDFADVLESIRLEYVDPVEGAGGGLTRTLDPPLREDASEAMRTAQARFPLAIPAWWGGRK
ncbi:MAG: putative quinol monooxygenase [Novosphingobium sp.]